MTWLGELPPEKAEREAKAKRKRKNSAAVSLGRKGGKAGSGAAKARSSEAARAAVLTRWKNHRAKTGKPNKADMPTCSK